MVFLKKKKKIEEPREKPIYIPVSLATPRKQFLEGQRKCRSRYRAPEFTGEIIERVKVLVKSCTSKGDRTGTREKRTASLILMKKIRQYYVC